MAAPETMAVSGSPKTMGLFRERKDTSTATKQRRLDYGIAARNRQVLNKGPSATLLTMSTDFERFTKIILEEFKGVHEKFDRIDDKFQRIDEKLSAIDRRVDSIEKRLDEFGE